IENLKKLAAQERSRDKFTAAVQRALFKIAYGIRMQILKINIAETTSTRIVDPDAIRRDNHAIDSLNHDRDLRLEKLNNASYMLKRLRKKAKLLEKKD
ncbi:MAG: hypothetical protein ACHQVK_01285, partial [Candidatus Paceibacterales bacterium]